MVQREPHELVLSLDFGRGTIDRPDQLQLLQVLERLKAKRLRVSQQTDCIGVQEMSTFCLVWGFGRKDWGKSFEAFLPTFMTTGCSKLYMELDFLCRNFLNSGNNQARVKKQTGQLLLFV